MLLMPSCKTAYQTAPFNETPVPTAPDYADERYWAVLPGQYPKQLEEITGPFEAKTADVFFVYPTLLVDKKNPSWNADVHQKDIRHAVLDQSVKYQASAFAAAAPHRKPMLSGTSRGSPRARESPRSAMEAMT